MSELKLATRDHQTQFRPGDTLHGVAGWNLDTPPTAVEVRLFWYTRGKGSEDISIVNTIPFDSPQSSEARPFEFTLPPEPYSFSGTLISLIWALELVALPAEESTRLEFTLSPTGAEILLK